MIKLHNQASLKKAKPTLVPSPQLLDLCRAYLDLVDHGAPEQQGQERTRVHNALIQQMVAEGIVEPSPHRAIVRWLARYFVETDLLNQAPAAPQTLVMFLRKDTFPPKLEALPPFYEQEESRALEFYVPVRVTIEPLVQQHDETARYGCESAPHYTGKKKGATPQFHVVALLVLRHTDIARLGNRSILGDNLSTPRSLRCRNNTWSN
jgi:hypothetical protein